MLSKKEVKDIIDALDNKYTSFGLINYFDSLNKKILYIKLFVNFSNVVLYSRYRDFMELNK